MSQWTCNDGMSDDELSPTVVINSPDPSSSSTNRWVQVSENNINSRIRIPTLPCKLRMFIQRQHLSPQKAITFTPMGVVIGLMQKARVKDTIVNHLQFLSLDLKSRRQMVLIIQSAIINITSNLKLL